MRRADEEMKYIEKDFKIEENGQILIESIFETVKFNQIKNNYKYYKVEQITIGADKQPQTCAGVVVKFKNIQYYIEDMYTDKYAKTLRTNEDKISRIRINVPKYLKYNKYTRTDSQPMPGSIYIIGNIKVKVIITLKVKSKILDRDDQFEQIIQETDERKVRTIFKIAKLQNQKKNTNKNKNNQLSKTLNTLKHDSKRKNDSYNDNEEMDKAVIAKDPKAVIAEQESEIDTTIDTLNITQEQENQLKELIENEKQYILATIMQEKPNEYHKYIELMKIHLDRKQEQELLIIGRTFREATKFENPNRKQEATKLVNTLISQLTQDHDAINEFNNRIQQEEEEEEERQRSDSKAIKRKKKKLKKQMKKQEQKQKELEGKDLDELCRLINAP